jgi:hypothetical protein
MPHRSRVEDLVGRLLGEVAQVEPVRAAPEELHRLLDVRVVDEGRPRGDDRGDHRASRLEPAVAGDEHRQEHALVDAEAPEPLRDEDVDLARELDVAHVALDDLDDIRETVRRGQLLGQPGNRGLLDGVHPCRPGACGQEAENAGSGTDVQHPVARSHDRLERPRERFRPDAIADQGPMGLELRVDGNGWIPDRRAHEQDAVLLTARAVCRPEPPQRGRAESLLADELCGAAALDVRRQLVGVIGRDQHDRGFRVSQVKKARRLDPVHLRHANVHQHEVRARLVGELQRPAPVGGLADRLEAVGRDDEVSRDPPEERLVVDDQDADETLCSLF